MSIGFSATERRLIADSFAAVGQDMPGATACFYRHLFALAPEARDLFVLDLDRQGEKLAQTLETVVAQLDRFGLLRASVEDLAIRHLAYGVERRHYAAAGEALIAMLRERLGHRLTAEGEAAWRRLYTVLSETMIDAAYPSESVAEGR